MPTCEWTDLLDPDENALRSAWPDRLHPLAWESLAGASVHDDEPRPKIESHGDYAFAVLVVPVEVPEDDRVYYQEVDLVVTESIVLTVRKPPPDGSPIDLSAVHELADEGLSAGMIAYHVFDQV